MTISEATPAPGGLGDRQPVSFNQEFLCLFDQADGTGPFGPRYHIVHGWRVRGAIDVDTLRAALDDVVERHETLRTLIVRDGGSPTQRVLPPSPVELVIRDLPGVAPQARARRAEELLNEIESGTIDADELPHVRAVLARFADDDAVLVLIAHHTATDGWSIRVIIRDLTARYAARRGHGVADLPKKRSYAEYVDWQREAATGAAADTARAYWREKLRGAGLFVFPTDRPRSAGVEAVTAVYRFSIPADLTGPTVKLARSMRSSPFMVLLAALNILLHRKTGVTDIVVPTFTPGRGQGQFDDTVGSFFNFMPLRTDIAGCATFRDVAHRARATCLEAYSHDIPTIQIFGEAPELMAPAMVDDHAPVVFQAFPFPYVLDGEVVGDLEYTEMRRRLLSQPVASDIPDGGLWTFNFDPSGDVIGSLQYRSNLFDESTIIELVREFQRVLGVAVSTPDARVDSI